MAVNTFLPANWPNWAIMWAIAVVLFAICKWLTWRGTSHQGTPLWRRVGYLLAWPGMDAVAFLDSRPLPVKQRPDLGEWLFAFGKTLLGAGLIWGVVPLVPCDLPLLRGWVGMAGLVFILHFGSFHILSCGWRALGVNARPLMNWPILAPSISDFWGRRWNTAFRDLTYRFFFRPLSTRLGLTAGVAVGFLASGIVHELVITVPAGGGYGWPTFYFVLQGFGLLVERSKFGKSLGAGKGWKGRAFALSVVIGPAYALFPPPFVLGVVLPFLAVIGVF